MIEQVLFYESHPLAMIRLYLMIKYRSVLIKDGLKWSELIHSCFKDGPGRNMKIHSKLLIGKFSVVDFVNQACYT